MKRGRPTKSEIRQNIVEILHIMGEGYGYEIHKAYIAIFPSCTREVVYYHLKKGVLLDEFVVERRIQEKGEYSWGGVVEKIYYKLGEKAQPKGNPEVTAYFEELKKKRKED